MKHGISPTTDTKLRHGRAGRILWLSAPLAHDDKGNVVGAARPGCTFNVGRNAAKRERRLQQKELRRAKIH